MATLPEHMTWQHHMEKGSTSLVKAFDEALANNANPSPELDVALKTIVSEANQSFRSFYTSYRSLTLDMQHVLQTANATGQLELQTQSFLHLTETAQHVQRWRMRFLTPHPQILSILDSFQQCRDIFDVLRQAAETLSGTSTSDVTPDLLPMNMNDLPSVRSRLRAIDRIATPIWHNMLQRAERFVQGIREGCERLRKQKLNLLPTYTEDPGIADSRSDMQLDAKLKIKNNSNKLSIRKK